MDAISGNNPLFDLAPFIAPKPKIKRARRSLPVYEQLSLDWIFLMPTTETYPFSDGTEREITIYSQAEMAAAIGLSNEDTYRLTLAGLLGFFRRVGEGEFDYSDHVYTENIKRAHTLRLVGCEISVFKEKGAKMRGSHRKATWHVFVAGETRTQHISPTEARRMAAAHVKHIANIFPELPLDNQQQRDYYKFEVNPLWPGASTISTAPSVMKPENSTTVL